MISILHYMVDSLTVDGGIVEELACPKHLIVVNTVSYGMTSTTWRLGMVNSYLTQQLTLTPVSGMWLGVGSVWRLDALLLSFVSRSSRTC